MDMDFENEEIMRLLDLSKSAAQKLIEERNYLRKTACIDPLTGLSNRYALKRVRDFTGIMMLDIDDFKKINDTYGHDKGDEVLQKIATLLTKSTRAKDCLCRLGGDEFLAVFVDCPHDVIRQRAALVGAVIAEAPILDSSSTKVTTSIGYAFNRGREPIEEVMKYADLALYDSKRKGKNMVTEYKSNLPMVIPEEHPTLKYKMN
jgi:diguanylate cyclase (GGDEF)-like protein